MERGRQGAVVRWIAAFLVVGLLGAAELGVDRSMSFGPLG
jgi:hypothetical protein